MATKRRRRPKAMAGSNWPKIEALKIENRASFNHPAIFKI